MTARKPAAAGAAPPHVVRSYREADSGGTESGPPAEIIPATSFSAALMIPAEAPPLDQELEAERKKARMRLLSAARVDSVPPPSANLGETIEVLAADVQHLLNVTKRLHRMGVNLIGESALGPITDEELREKARSNAEGVSSKLDFLAILIHLHTVRLTAQAQQLEQLLPSGRGAGL